MNLGFLMIVLTLLETGQMSAAFVNTKSLEECENRANGVRTILTGQKVAIKELVCRSSGAQFEPFSHGATSGPPHSYDISFDDRKASITPRTEGAACSDALIAERDPAKPIRYCATSTQKLLSNEN